MTNSEGGARTRGQRLAARIKALGSPSNRELAREAKERGRTLDRQAIARILADDPSVEQTTADRLEWLLGELEHEMSVDEPSVEVTIVVHPDGTKTITARGHNAADVEALLEKYVGDAR